MNQLTGYISKKTAEWVLLIAVVFVSQQVHAVSGVNPSGVNVNHAGVTTVFLTFQNLNPNEQALESFWCSEVVSTGASAFNPCVPGTIIGTLPQRNNLSRDSGTGGVNNLTDIMTIPMAVTRKAVQVAQAGGNGTFFYVRRFNDGISDTFVTVTCRLAGGGARSPLAITEVRIGFDTGESLQPVYFLPRDGEVPAVKTKIKYTGTGQLKGRWEVVMPGDPEPTDLDLLTEATLPVEQRASQRRYTLVSRFDIFLPPTGEAELPQPNRKQIPTHIDGPYKLLLRIEASAEKEGDSNTISGVVNSGGVAGFPLPVLRYYIGSGDAANRWDQHMNGRITLLTPLDGVSTIPSSAVIFSWQPIDDAVLYELNIKTDDAVALSAIVKANSTQYAAPPWLTNQSGQSLRWSVKALATGGKELASSDERILQIGEQQ